jgi:hypothetical protein
MAITRQRAEEIATEIVCDLLRSGDEKIYAAASDVEGRVDHVRLVAAAMRAAIRIADDIQKNENELDVAADSPFFWD